MKVSLWVAMCLIFISSLKNWISFTDYSSVFDVSLATLGTLGVFIVIKDLFKLQKLFKWSD